MQLGMMFSFLFLVSSIYHMDRDVTGRGDGGGREEKWERT